MPGPLEGIRVVDLTRGNSGSHATKLLADYGATVTKLEPPGGDPLRHLGPFKDDVANPETSAPFLFLNTNKRSVLAGLTDSRGRELARGLILGSDAVVEDYAPGALARLGLDLGELRARRPPLVVCSITPFGQTGPYAGFVATDIVLQAMGGAMYATGHADREPLRLGGNFAEWHAGLAAALAVMLALYRAEQTGAGEHIDLSIYETQAGGKDRRQLALLGHAYSGLVTRRHDTAFAICCGVRPCLDGYINLLGNGPRLRAVLQMIGRDDLLDRPELDGPEELLPPDLVEEIESAYLGWTACHTMREALAIAQAHRILGGAVFSIADVLSDPEFRARGMWETIDHPATGPIEYPSRPFLMSDSPRPPARRAPLLGEHTADEAPDKAPRPPIMGELAKGQDSAARIGALGSAPVRNNVQPSPANSASISTHALRVRAPRIGGQGADNPAQQSPATRLPLAGVRVLDMTVVWAGPFATQLLAEWGAEVIRVEPLTALQPQTRGVERARHLTRELVERGVASGSLSSGYPECEPGPDPWNRNPLFNASSSNKLSCTSNTTAAGRAAFEELVTVADVVVENNVPSTAAKLGLTYERLRAVNPAIILVRMPGFGLTGRYADYRCWGNHLEGMAGHHIIRAYPDLALDAVGETYACDSVAGLTAALAAVMALRHRAQTGRGQQVEVPQIEAFIQMLGVEILDYTLDGRVAEAMGNDHRDRAPHGAYPCAGEDRWIAIDAGSVEQWRALCQVLDAAQLAVDPRFATPVDRWRNRRELDRELGALTCAWDRMELFRRLQDAGVPAGPVQDEADCFNCPQLAARGFFQEQTRHDLGTHRYPGMLFQWAGTPNRHRRPPVKLGQDNAYVYRSLLGYNDAAYQRLVDLGEVGTTYPDWLLRAGATR